VGTVAVRWGLYHLGRFSTEYRRMFGESPSETRRTARRR
jgi:AraC-like DNA-binding protein